MKLHFGDEQFEVDAAQLPIAFTQVTLGGGEKEVEEGTNRGTIKGGRKSSCPPAGLRTHREQMLRGNLLWRFGNKLIAVFTGKLWFSSVH